MVHSTPLGLMILPFNSLNRLESDTAMRGTLRLFLDQFDFSEDSGLDFLSRMLITARVSFCSCELCILGAPNVPDPLFYPRQQSLCSSVLWLLLLFQSQIRLWANDHQLAGFINSIVRTHVGYRSEILDRALAAAERKRLDEIDYQGGFSPLHCCFEDMKTCEGLEVFCNKGANLHLLGRRRYYGYPAGQDRETPLSLAMRSSYSFRCWRNALRKSNVNLQDYIAHASKEPPISAKGWSQASLRVLFQYYTDVSCGDPSNTCCSCCKTCWSYLIEVSWQRTLDMIKAGQESQDELEGLHCNESVRTSGTLCEKGDEADWEDVHEDEFQESVSGRWQDKHPWLCWYCWNDEILKTFYSANPGCPHYPYHVEKDESPNSEKSSDEEDSPLLIPIPG